jgi:hypothetical protein
MSTKPLRSKFFSFWGTTTVFYQKTRYGSSPQKKTWKDNNVWFTHHGQNNQDVTPNGSVSFLPRINWPHPGTSTRFISRLWTLVHHFTTTLPRSRTCDRHNTVSEKNLCQRGYSFRFHNSQWRDQSSSPICKILILGLCPHTCSQEIVTRVVMFPEVRPTWIFRGR